MNTVNWIISVETKGRAYNHLESSTYTRYNIRMGKCDIDRKDLVFTGSGRILLVEILLVPAANVTQVLEEYVKKYSCELNQMLGEYYKKYSHGKVKVIAVTDKLKHNLLYTVKAITVAEFEQEKRPHPVQLGIKPRQ